jgi:transcriptional regulator GlxA family with amidase domain
VRVCGAARAPPVADGSSLEPVLRWLDKHLQRELTLPDVARRAQALLERTDLSVERVAADAGFGSVAGLRVHFRRLVATSPRAYRRAFRTSAGGRRPVVRSLRTRGL